MWKIQLPVWPNQAVQLTPLARQGTWARLFRQSAAACCSLRQRSASSIRHVVCHGRFTSRRRRLALCLLLVVPPSRSLSMPASGAANRQR